MTSSNDATRAANCVPAWVQKGQRKWENLLLAVPTVYSCLSCHVMGSLTELLPCCLGNANELKPAPAEGWPPNRGAVIKQHDR